MKHNQQSIRVSRAVWERLRRLARALGTSNYNAANMLLTDIMDQMVDDDGLWMWYRTNKTTEEQNEISNRI
jgi:hypothetical protein